MVPGSRGSESSLSREKWGGKFSKLAAYQARHGDCNVPYKWADDPKLGKWVDNQRSLKKLLDRGEPKCKGMTAARAAKLSKLGFAWEELPESPVQGRAVKVGRPKKQPKEGAKPKTFPQ